MADHQLDDGVVPGGIRELEPPRLRSCSPSRRRWAPRSSRSCSGRWRRSRSTGSGSSDGRRSRSCSSCRSPCRAIVTGMALNSTINTAGFPFGLMTIIAGHATFCVVVVYNNAIARLRRSSKSLDEASADLGASPIQTFRYVTMPLLRGALFAGALLAFALSFDEVIVTTFTAGHTGHPADLDPRPPPASERAADRQRRRGPDRPGDDGPDLHRAAAVRRGGCHGHVGIEPAGAQHQRLPASRTSAIATRARPARAGRHRSARRRSASIGAPPAGRCRQSGRPIPPRSARSRPPGRAVSPVALIAGLPEDGRRPPRPEAGYIDGS